MLQRLRATHADRIRYLIISCCRFVCIETVQFKQFPYNWHLLSLIGLDLGDIFVLPIDYK